MTVSEDTYHTPGLTMPTLEDIQALNKEMKFMCPDDQLKEMAGDMSLRAGRMLPVKATCQLFYQQVTDQTTSISSIDSSLNQQPVSCYCRLIHGLIDCFIHSFINSFGAVDLFVHLSRYLSCRSALSFKLKGPLMTVKTVLHCVMLMLRKREKYTYVCLLKTLTSSYLSIQLERPLTV